MTPNDIKHPMVLTLRNGEIGYVFPFVNDTGWGMFHGNRNLLFGIIYNNELNHIYTETLDIMRITLNDEVIWERENDVYYLTAFNQRQECFIDQRITKAQLEQIKEIIKNH